MMLSVFWDKFRNWIIGLTAVGAVGAGGTYTVFNRVDIYPRTKQYNQTTIENKTDWAVHYQGLPEQLPIERVTSLNAEGILVLDTVKIDKLLYSYADHQNKKWKHGIGYMEAIIGDQVWTVGRYKDIAYNVGGRDNIRTFGVLLLDVESDSLNNVTWETMKQRKLDLQAEQGFNFTTSAPHLWYKINQGSYTTCAGMWYMQKGIDEGFYQTPDGPLCFEFKSMAGLDPRWYICRPD